MSSSDENSGLALAPERGKGDNIAISVRNLSKSYQIYDKPGYRLMQAVWRGRKRFFREFWALKNISFEVRKGETLGIIGRNGSGKSTLLQLICSTLTPTSGEVEVNGQVAALLELGAGFNPEFTGRENVYMNAAILGISKSRIDAKFQEIIDFAEIGESIEQPVKTYSSGMFIRLAFAVQVCVVPDILIIDEALSVGDIFFQQKCMERMRQLVHRGTTIIFVSHDMSAITRLCGRALLLSAGRIVVDGPPSRVIEQYTAISYGTSLNQPDIEHLPAPTRKLQSDDRRGIALRPIPDGVFRHGNRAMLISGFALTTEFNDPLSQIESGRLLKITLEIQCYDQRLVPNVGIQIKDRFGNIACGTNTWMLGYKMDVEERNTSFQIAFDIQIMLGSGEYTLSAAVTSYDAKPEKIFDWIDRLTIFRVLRSEPWVDGIAYCPVKINLNR